MDLFHKNYKTIYRFVHVQLPEATRCTSLEKGQLIHHYNIIKFMSNFSLQIYIGLRQTGLLGRVRTAIERHDAAQEAMAPALNHSHSGKAQSSTGARPGERSGLAHSSSSVALSVVECMGRCWDEKTVYLEPLVTELYSIMASILELYIGHVETTVKHANALRQTSGGGHSGAAATMDQGEENNNHALTRLIPQLNESVRLVTKALHTTLLERITATLRKHNKSADIDRAIEITTMLFRYV